MANAMFYESSSKKPKEVVSLLYSGSCSSSIVDSVLKNNSNNNNKKINNSNSINDNRFSLLKLSEQQHHNNQQQQQQLHLQKQQRNSDNCHHSCYNNNKLSTKEEEGNMQTFLGMPPLSLSSASLSSCSSFRPVMNSFSNTTTGANHKTCDVTKTKEEGVFNNNTAITNSKTIIMRGNSSSSNKRSEIRSVVINAPPSPKRQKLCCTFEDVSAIKQVVQALNMSFTKQDRLCAIIKARDTFLHNVQQLHDYEIITEGADMALTKHISFLAFKTTFRRRSGIEQVTGEEQTIVNSLLDEASLACETLESVYRASSSSVSESFKRLGPELLNALVILIDGELSRRKYGVAREEKEISIPPKVPTTAAAAETTRNSNNNNNQQQQHQQGFTEERIDNNNSSNNNNCGVADEQDPLSYHHYHRRSVTPPNSSSAPSSSTASSPECHYKKEPNQGDLLLRSATKIFGHLARVGDATKPMAYFPGVLGCVLNLISSFWYDRIPSESRLSSLWTLANLACNIENMQMMMCTPGLLRTLVCIGSRALQEDYSVELTMEVLRARSITSRAILNLSWLPENKIALCQSTALIELLTKLSVQREVSPNRLNRSRTVKDIILQTRRHAVNAIRILASAPRRTKILLCTIRHQGYILDVLTDVALNDEDESTKDLAFAAIRNLAVHDTAELMVQRPALVLLLKGALTTNNNTSNNNNNPMKTLTQFPQQRDDDIIKRKDRDSPRSNASATLLVLERSITPDMEESYQSLRDLLEAINPNPTHQLSDDEDTPMSQQQQQQQHKELEEGESEEQRQQQAQQRPQQQTQKSEQYQEQQELEQKQQLCTLYQKQFYDVGETEKHLKPQQQQQQNEQQQYQLMILKPRHSFVEV